MPKENRRGDICKFSTYRNEQGETKITVGQRNPRGKGSKHPEGETCTGKSLLLGEKKNADAFFPGGMFILKGKKKYLETQAIRPRIVLNLEQ